MGSKPRSLEVVLCAGGECRDGDEIIQLLELSLQVLAAAHDKRLACDLLATPSRMRLPIRVERGRSFLEDTAGIEPDDGPAAGAPTARRAAPTRPSRRGSRATATAPATRRSVRAAPAAVAAAKRTRRRGA